VKILATYPVVHKETGEQKEVTMSVNEWDQWKVENPEWIRDWSDPSTCPQPGEVGEWKAKSNGKKKKIVCRATYRGWSHCKADEEEETSKFRLPY